MKDIYTSTHFPANLRDRRRLGFDKDAPMNMAGGRVRDAKRKLNPAPQPNDKVFDHALLEPLELGLTQALAQMAENERNAAKVALEAFLEFIISVPGWDRRGLGDPVFCVLTALEDLDHGRVVSMLSPNPKVRNRKPDAVMRKIFKAYAVFCVDVLCRAGFSVADGCRFVAEVLRENNFPLRGRAESAPWKIVSGWRDGITKLAENDQVRLTLEDLRTELGSPNLSKEEAVRFVKGQLDELFVKMGQAALE